MDRIIDEYNWVQRSSRQRMSPFPNYLSMESICREMKEFFGFCYDAGIIVYHKNDQTTFFDEKSDQIIDEKGLKLLKEDPDLITNQISTIKNISKEFLDKLSNLNASRLKDYSDQEIAQLFCYFENEYKSIYPRYFFIVTVERALIKLLNDILARNVSDETEREKMFTILTTEPEAMVNFREQRDRLKVIDKIRLAGQWQKLFSGSTEKINQELKNIDNGEIKKIITNHHSQYFWITRDYEDQIITFSEMIDRIRLGVTDNENYTLLKRKVGEFSNHAQSIAEAEKIAKLDAKEAKLFKALRDGINLKETRKAIVSQALYYFDPVLETVSKRSGLPIKLVRFLRTGEILPFLQGKIQRQDIEDRFVTSYWVSDGKHTEVLSGSEADKQDRKLFNVENITEFKGFPISAGRATGKAKVMMDPNESSKIENGDIIVTIQAVPSFSPAISRAAGIIADGGTGLTSHTATLAREAKIPGVSGLKFASKVIKDGDIIEIDGSNGIVKILKKKE